MNSEVGSFMLRQIVSSLVVVGPLLLLIGFFNYIFKQSKRVVIVYVFLGLICTALGAMNLAHLLDHSAEAPQKQIQK